MTHRYGTARGLSTAEKLSDSQVVALRILAHASASGARALRRNHGVVVSRQSVESLVRLGLAERVPVLRRRPREAARYTITKVGRAILNGRTALDRETDAIEQRRSKAR